MLKRLRRTLLCDCKTAFYFVKRSLEIIFLSKDPVKKMSKINLKKVPNKTVSFLYLSFSKTLTINFCIFLT